MDAPIENSPGGFEPPPKFLIPFGLSKDAAHLISGYLTNRDLVSLCMSSQGFHSLFYPSLEKRLMSYFLKFVVEGRLDKVGEILSKNQKLVFLHGDITDLSGRVFTRITAFQYAAWALDKEMWELILKYIPETDAHAQLMELEQERQDITRKYGTYFSFAPLLDAYQKYSDNFEMWFAAERWDQLEACWCEEVGGAQRQLPAWFVYVFCEEGSDKAWPTNNFKKNFRRDPKYLNWWFDQEYRGGKLGSKWAIWRARHPDVRLAGLSSKPEIDRQHLSSCQAERTSCRDSLSDYLKRTVEAKKSCRALNNNLRK